MNYPLKLYTKNNVIKMMNRKLLLSLVMISVLGLSTLSLNPVFGHGSPASIAPPADFFDRMVTVFIEMDPPAIFADTPERATLYIRFFDQETDEGLPHITYRVWVNKDDRTLMNEWFYDPNGELRLQIRPTQTDRVRVFGDQELQLGGYWNRGNPVPVEAPIFLEGGMYNVFVEIFTVGTTRQIIDPPLVFDTWLSIGEANHFSIIDEGVEHPVTIRTYFDRITELTYDDNEKEMRFTMPFNWDPEWTRFVVIVHEEVVIPREFGLFADASEFEATVNGVPVSGRILLVDPYSFEDEVVVHFLLTPLDIERITEEIAPEPPYPQEMVFTLRPADVDRERKSMDLMTGNDRMRILVGWDREVIEPDIPIAFDIAFFDAQTNELVRDLRYDFRIVDEIGVVYEENDVLASEGIDIHMVTFERTGTATIEVDVIGVGVFDIQLDTYYTGTATGSVTVVPEFPLGVFVVAGTVIAAMLAMVRFKGLQVRN